MSVGRLAALLALAVGLVACGGDDDSTATTVAVATTSVPGTAVARTVPSATVASTVATTSGSTTSPAAVTCGSGPVIDPEGSLRDQFVGYLASCGFTPQEATCLFDNLDFGDPAVAGGESGPIVAAFGECGIDQARAAEIGG
jgi:hypothetical protein